MKLAYFSLLIFLFIGCAQKTFPPPQAEYIETCYSNHCTVEQKLNGSTIAYYDFEDSVLTRLILKNPYNNHLKAIYKFEDGKLFDIHSRAPNTTSIDSNGKLSRTSFFDSRERYTYTEDGYISGYFSYNDIFLFNKKTLEVALQSPKEGEFHLHMYDSDGGLNIYISGHYNNNNVTDITQAQCYENDISISIQELLEIFNDFPVFYDKQRLISFCLQD